MRRAFKYRIYPTKVQAQQLDLWLGHCRELYNAAIEERREAWKHGVRIGFFEQSKELPVVKQERPEFANIYSQVLQQVIHRVDFAFQQFFGRIKNGEKPGYPRFKGRDRYNSLTWPQDIGFRLISPKKIRLGGIGCVRIRFHRPITGKPKMLTLKRRAGKWYAIFSCADVLAKPYPEAIAEIGIDMGLKSFATLSTGEKIENPRWYRKTEERLSAAQRALSRKNRGSKRREKAKAYLVRLYAKITNQRNDFQHKLAHRIVSENAMIVVEDLDVREMTHKSTSGLNKSITDAAWSRFLDILGVKAEEAGRRFVKVPPRGTSSTCSQCGLVRQKTLSERIHSCSCGLLLDRDVNAAINILRLGRSLQVNLRSPCH
jgi:putative transposase